VTICATEVDFCENIFVIHDSHVGMTGDLTRACVLSRSNKDCVQPNFQSLGGDSLGKTVSKA